MEHRLIFGSYPEIVFIPGREVKTLTLLADSYLYKDVLTGLVFMTGLFGFLSGEFIISSALFATAAIASNVNTNRKRRKIGSNA